mgnify:CR=1 FL=1
MIKLMNKTDLAERCKNYLERILDETDIKDESIIIGPNKHQIHVSDIELFNTMASKNGVYSMGNNNVGEIYCHLICPGKEEDDYFTVFLSRGLKDDFLNKYGDKYRII